MASDFSGFKHSPFCRSQFCNALVQTFTTSALWWKFSGVAPMYSCVSSAYWWNDIPCDIIMFETGEKYRLKSNDLIILHRFLLTCTGYRSPSVSLTRSVCLCSSVWKGWPLPIFLISVLALQLLWVVLVWDLQLEVILLCRDTGQSGVQGLLLWLVQNVGTNCRLDSEICRLVLKLSRDAWRHTCSELAFLIRHALLSLYYIL